MRDPLGNIRALKGGRARMRTGGPRSGPKQRGPMRLLYAHVDPQKSRLFCLHRVLDGGS